MNLKILLALALALFALTSPAIADTVTTVFGLPLGGKFAAPKHVCSAGDDAGATPPRKYCWTERTSYKGYYSGGIHLPNDKHIPQWALYATLSVVVGNDGMLNSISVRTYDESAADTIAKSISSRFGPPTTSDTFRGGRVIEWREQEIDITIRCYSSGCKIDFISANERSRSVIERAKRKAIDAARPASP